MANDLNIQTEPSHNIENDGHKDFNYYITKFFLKNSRLTILCLILLAILGIGSTMLLKTTGFPDPEIKTAVVSTIYRGASSETVSKDVTEPLEGAIKDVQGVSNYVSTSTNSSSQIVISIDQSANADSARSKIDSAVRSVTLPSAVDAPKLITPQIGSSDFFFSIASTDNKKMFDIYDRFNKDLSQIPETSKVETLTEIKRRVLVTINKDKLKTLNVPISQVQTQLSSFGETLPVVTGATIDGESKGITTKLNSASLEDVQNFRINITVVGSNDLKTYKLTDLAEVKVDYYFENKAGSLVQFGGNENKQVLPAVVVTVRAAKGTDKSIYGNKIHNILSSYNDTTFIKTKEELPKEIKDVVVAESFSVNDSNKEQVDEVISGLIGGPLDVNNPIVSNLGWILGGIQLVFLAMLAFVSWRAALIAAVSIPLSLLFSSIYLYFRGESLNTLVLFSLVLVIGLVVDPSLVILESIQRKIDTGLRGKEAVLEAVTDVGSGLFLAALTNIIVFLPFGVISGVLGQIFSYIPATIIPATIGSYLVPLVFLAWIGGLFLKPTKTGESSEEENLWPIAKWLIKTNNQILHGSVWVRMMILGVAIIVPVFVAGFYFGTGRIKSVQFSSSQNGNEIALTGSFKSTLPQVDRQIVKREILELISKYDYVEQTFEQRAGLNYYIKLKEAKDRPGTITTELAKTLEKDIKDKYNSFFFDLAVKPISNGPPAGGYQVAIGVKTNDLDKLEVVAKDVGKTIGLICKTGPRVVKIDADCKNGQRIVTKIDDGYTDKENKELDIILDRQKLYDEKLVPVSGPVSSQVNQQVAQQFILGSDKKIATIKIENDEVEVFLDKNQVDPSTLESIKNTKITNNNGTELSLDNISNIEEKSPKDLIQRVKGQTIGAVQARLSDGNTDQGTAGLVTNAILDHYKANDGEKIKALGLNKDAIEQYSEGSSADFLKSFQELFIALILAIFLTYLVLAVFFGSLTQPLVILFTIPLSFMGVFPALSAFTSGEFGFLEIIGFIILVGIVENVAIFLIDAANQKIRIGWDDKRAIVYASGIRFRSVILTKLTAIASLAPLAFLSEFYRSISIVIMFGLLASGFVSLITTPILFIFFRWSSKTLHRLIWWQKILFFVLYPIAIVYIGYKEGNLDFKWIKKLIEKQN